MKYSYPLPGTYSRSAQYTPTQYTTSKYTPTQYTTSKYTPTQYTTSKYTPAQYTTSKYTPSLYTPSVTSTTRYTPTATYGSSHCSPSSHYAPSYKSAAAAAYVPSYTRGSRGATTRRSKAQDAPPPPAAAPAPAAPLAPPPRAVHFPNDIIFQDLVRRGDMEQIGRFMRARKVRLDTLFHSGMAPLHEAVLTGNLEVVKELVRYGADVHQRDEDGWTPLHMACSDGFPLIASFLLSAGGSREAQNNNGEKPADLIDPDYKELAQLFETGCV
ncbi:protein phosphatase 1 regulatory subunit 12C [Gadus morhua]|uniref:Protein phosphatase 1, regulatory subunit 27a n=1 Tax=Gadus morhua TaxID=8049 RepID=A0A8C4ZD08_GADMO|nr:protein phosphatase 1 regulatory subunit 12C-like [Gadus morhua]